MEWTVWAAAALVLAALLVVVASQRRRKSASAQVSPSAKLPLPPGTLGLPWFGDTGLGLYLRHPAEWNTRKRAIYGDVFKARLFWRDTILLSRPLDNHWLLHVRSSIITI
jgi:(+)-abscisic acid 8'-hydroxylase